jgi:hypothetical protein
MEISHRQGVGLKPIPRRIGNPLEFLKEDDFGKCEFPNDKREKANL